MAQHTKFQREILRKAFHLLGLFVILGYSILMINFGQRVGLLALTALLLILLEVEYVRLSYDMKFPGIITHLLRHHEKDKVTGAIWLVTASIIAFSVFDYPIAFLSFFYVIFGDTVASLVGVRFGKRKLFQKKSWAGFLAGLSVNILSGVFILPNAPVLYLSMALTGSVVELLTNKLDDNLTVPLFAGFVGQIIISVGHLLA